MRPHLLLVLSLAVAGTAGCDGYVRTNPLDPEYPIALSIVGPDTIYSVNDTVTFQVTTEPSHPNLAFIWSAADPARLELLPPTLGRFASRQNGPTRLRVEYGTHSAEKTVVVKQRAVGLRIAPP